MSETGPDLARLRIDRDRTPPKVKRALGRNVFLAAAAIIVVIAFVIITRGRTGGPTVEVALVELSGGSGGGSSGVTANGYVVARTQASISSKITGRLEYLEVEEGSVVEKGQVIARLEASDYVAALAQQQAELGTARAALTETEAERDQLIRDVARTRDLQARGLASQQEREQLEAQLATAEARVGRFAAQVEAAEAGVGVARANLDNTTIRAPFSGTVLRKDAEVGEVVAPVATGTGLTRGAVVTMADMETLEVEVDVNEAYISRVHHGQAAAIALDAFPNERFSGRVRQIVPTADRQRATVLVKVEIVQRDPRILPEMGATVEFLDDTVSTGPAMPASVFVPSAAVKDDAGRQVVWVVSGDRVERREVEAGPVSGGRREIRSGLAGGERVVVAGAEGLEDGARVRVAQRQ
ncbi:MAG TPA: efflux RND transporter periplasmic adaptor subunit [Gemmatimonadota bacterium]|nr:efflux RND transporter periplasmic adaptor subunit [Gemmatimonadota bacterium]